MIHDVVCNNVDDLTCPISRSEGNLYFYQEMVKIKYPFALEYYYGVIILGWPFHYIGKIFKYIKRLMNYPRTKDP
jgi:hypothetical protein